MAMVHSFEVGIGLKLDDEFCKKIVENFKLEGGVYSIKYFLENEFHIEKLKNNPIEIFSTGNYIGINDVDYWIGINLGRFDLSRLEKLLQNKDKIIEWFSEFGLNVKWEDLKFIKELVLYSDKSF